MGLLLPLLLCLLATCCNTRSFPQTFYRTFLLDSHDCNDSSVLDTVGLALQSINNDRKEGYALSLNRVRDVREHRQASDSPPSGAVCTSCMDWPVGGNPETHVCRCFPNWKPAENSLLPSARLCNMLLLLLGTSANNILL